MLPLRREGGESETCRATYGFCEKGQKDRVTAVTPAEAGVQKRLQTLDSRLRGNDKGPSLFPCFYPRSVLGGGLSDKFYHRGFQGFAPSIWRWLEKR